MYGKTKLLLVACSGHDTAQLAKDIHKILKKDFGLEDQVELLLSRKCRDIDKELQKNYRTPAIADYFPDMEVQVDIGRNELKDVIRGKHVALVEHLLTPNRKVSVNDHIMTVRGFFNVINEVETLQRTLIAPYHAYVRSHSVEKYRKSGFFQFDSLRMTMKDFANDGLNTFLTIDTHSKKAMQIAEEFGIDYHNINPFHSGRSTNPYKLGLSGEKAKEIMPKLRPFQEIFSELKAKKKNIYLYGVCVDDGTERRIENFIERANPDLSPEEFYALIAYLHKSRINYGELTSKFKPFSQITPDNIDPEGIYIIIDDMFASGGTGFNAGRIFKECGAQRVECWTSHAVTMSPQYNKANQRDYVDFVRCLDTVPQSPKLEITQMKASAYLLSAELYKSHEKLVASR